MATTQIPLAAGAQTLSTTLNGKPYRLRLTYNEAGPYWVLDIANDAGQRLLCGIPLLPGQDLLRAYRYMGFGGALVVVGPGDPNEPPRYEELAATRLLFTPY